MVQLLPFVATSASVAMAVVAVGTSASAPVCTTAMDCHLGGICTPAGSCECDATWRGATCEQLNVAPGSIAYAPPNRSSWGGGPPVLSPIDNKFHLYVSEMGGHCGLDVWQSMSTIVDTVSSTASAAGPYTRVGVVVPREAHNAYYTYDPASETHLIYHIGGGDNGDQPPLWTNCTNGSTPGSGSAAGLAALKDPPLWAHVQYVHHAASLAGPWLRQNFTNPPAGGNDSDIGWGNDNPAPYIYPNGTVLMLTRRYQSPKRGVEPHDTIWLVTAPSWKGPYHFVSDKPVLMDWQGQPTRENMEDPCLWRNARGHFHALFHFGHRHAWSADGLHWSVGNISVWDTTVGSTLQKDAERPRIWIDPATGSPGLLFTACRDNTVKKGPGELDRSFTVVQPIGRAQS